MPQHHKYIKRKKKKRILKTIKSSGKVHKNVQMLHYLMDTNRDLRQIRLPFSVNHVGVYHEVLLAGTEKIQQQRDLLRALDEYCRGSFGGPIRNEKEWIDFEKYKVLRGLTHTTFRLQEPIPPSKLMRQDSPTLLRSPTPPSAFHLFAGFLDDERFRWASFMDQLDQNEISRSSLMLRVNPLKKQCKTNSDHTKDSDYESLKKKLSSQSFLIQDSTETTDSDLLEDAFGPFHVQAAYSVLDIPSKIELGTSRIPIFKNHHGYSQPERFTHKTTDFVVKLHQELQEAQKMNHVRLRIRYRHTDHLPNTPTLNGPFGHTKSHESLLLDQMPTMSRFMLRQPLMTQAEEEFLFRYGWFPRGLPLSSTKVLNLPLYHAWDIGRRGCLAKVTIFVKNTQGLSHCASSYLRYLVMDGTAQEAFLTIYTSGNETFWIRQAPRKILILSVVDFLNANWSVSPQEIQIYCNKNYNFWSTILLQNLTIPFFSALIACVRFNMVLYRIHKIRRLRFFLQEFDSRIRYITSLKNILFYIKALAWKGITDHVQHKTQRQSQILDHSIEPLT